MKYAEHPMTAERDGRPPRRGAWIEIHIGLFLHTAYGCRPPRRGAWIEMWRTTKMPKSNRVAPRAGGRGLKYNLSFFISSLLSSPPAQGGVD